MASSPPPLSLRLGADGFRALDEIARRRHVTRAKAARQAIAETAESTSTPSASFHPEIVVGEETTRVMCEMVGAVDARALGKRAGHLTLDEMRAVDEALEPVLDLG